jgi:tetratricopeptide (TPR) repeat protein
LRARSQAPDADGDPTAFRLSVRGLAPALGASLVLGLGILVVHEGWKVHRVRQVRSQASDLDRSGDAARLDRKTDLLEAVARQVPDDARLQLELAFAHVNALDQRMYELAADAPAPGGDAVATGSEGARQGPDPAKVGQLRRAHLTPALGHLLRARDLCPMRAMVHLEIADHVAEFIAADPRAAYLERAKLLAPGDPGLWYRCGLHELGDGRPDRAWASWRRSLALSERDLPEILDRSVATLGPRDTLRRIFPDQPGVLLAAAKLLDSRPGDASRLFRERALALFEGRPGPPSAEELHTRATIQRALGRPAEALQTYHEALLQAPHQIGWRYERAELAHEQGRFEDAHQELLVILAIQRHDPKARALLDAVARGLAEHR